MLCCRSCTFCYEQQCLSLSASCQVFAAGPKFAGIKMLPPGVHLISYQAAGTPGQFAPAVSTFKYLNPKEVVVRMWDQGLEGLVELQDEEEVRPAACIHLTLFSPCRSYGHLIAFYTPNTGVVSCHHDKWGAVLTHCQAEAVDCQLMNHEPACHSSLSMVCRVQYVSHM